MRPAEFDAELRAVLVEDIVGLGRVVSYIRAGRHDDAIESCHVLARSLERLIELADAASKEGT